MKHEIPTQHDGRKMDASESISFAHLADAKQCYDVVRSRLLCISHWYQIAELPMATFTHLDNVGQATLQTPNIGDYIQIDIPGPGLPSTDGFDYVQIERIDESNDPNLQALTITLRPCVNPLSAHDDETKHFFKNIATSTLQIQRINNSINANYFGRNEVINLEVDALSDKIRNFIIGAGAKLGASFPQWKSLLKGLLNTNISTSDQQCPS
ncbi:hypothetical protein [Sphingobacterium sp. SYP-B4668]|uniref:hypothetical protein n=1 Tax=Sphingobacterium sp. SYP-B4668 TaxID=2996035 RepID=UPI0022DD491D|nr:hypothetical protein [Sphingobacterium sp. SYP-B4668]